MRARTWRRRSAGSRSRRTAFPAYFAGANRELLDPGLAPGEAAAALDAWYAWHWARTGLALAATGLAAAALAGRDASGAPAGALGKGSP